MREKWKPVPGYEGIYQVSDQGRVRSQTRNVEKTSKTGKPYQQLIRGRVLRPGLMTCGHLSVSIKRNNSRTVHSLVMEAFVGPRPEKQEVRHLNGNPADNRLVNLAYGTRTQNILDAVEHGTWFSDRRRAHNAALCAANAKRFQSAEYIAEMKARRG